MLKRFQIQDAILTIVIVTVTVPFVPLLLWSFTDHWFFPAIIPQQFGLRAWHYIFSTAGTQIINGIWASFGVAFLTMILSLVFGIPAGRSLGLHRFPGKKICVIILLLPIVVPPLSTSMGLHLWFLQLGLTETIFGVVLVHLTFCLPYTIFVLWGVFADFNPDFEAQSRSLGASRLQTIQHVTIPMILPGVTVAALFSFLLSWSQYLCTLIIGGGKILTLPMLLFSLMDSGDRPVASAVSLVFILPVVGVLLASAHYLGKRSLTGMR